MGDGASKDGASKDGAGSKDAKGGKRMLKGDARGGSDAGANDRDAGGSDAKGGANDRDAKGGVDSPAKEPANDKDAKGSADGRTPAKGKPSASGNKKPVKKTRAEIKEEMFKPKITMQKSRKLCNQVEVTDPDTKVPFVKGKFIGCVELIKKSSKQAVRFCDKASVVDVQPNDKADDVLATISVDDVKVGGNEKDPVKRKAAVNKGMEALTVLKSMRDKPVDQDKLADKKLAAAKGGDAKGKDGADAKGSDAKGKDGADAKEAEKKDVPKKTSDKRKKGSPMNQSRIMCNARCAGTCEQRGLRKTSCTCGEGQHGKWCNTNKKVKEKKRDYCAKFTEGQKDAHCAGDWDDAT